MIGFEWSTADIVIVIVLGLLYVRISTLQKRLTGIMKLNAKIDAILRSSGIPFDFLRNLPEGGAQALRSGKKIEAIKAYRHATGAGLEESKEFIEFIQSRETISP